jgi:predicted TIM-barrel fold metal-dependent hydrolase
MMMELNRYRPRSSLVTKKTEVNTPRFPVIDAHNHLADPFGGGWDQKEVPLLLEILDQAGVRVYVDLDGGWGEDILHRHLDHFKNFSPERFCIFGGVNWDEWLEKGDDFPEWAAQRLVQQKERGAEGLKIWKPFGLKVKDHHASLVSVDDPRLDPIWQTAAELHLPVVIHVADPVAFFDPLDEFNERWEELHEHPDWYFPSPPYPSFMSILTALARLVERHPQTTFIGAHVGCYVENLDWVGRLLDRCPNFYVDIAARLPELGRQPYSARRFFLQYSDRILFGTDLSPDLPSYRLYYRFLETDDEYFSHDTVEPSRQGRWHVHGLFLPDDVLEKVYFLNANHVLIKKDSK